MRLIHGDSLSVLRAMPDNSVDSVVTDPPYGLSKEPDARDLLSSWLAEEDYVRGSSTHVGFMGKSWDSVVPGPLMWKECLRVLKPGGHLFAFGGTRTYDLLTLALRMSGFEVREVFSWLHGQGFPKSMDVSKAIDKAAGAKRNRVDLRGGIAPGANNYIHEGTCELTMPDAIALTPDAEQWEGWGTALKPAYEPIVLARKPLGEKTVAANVLEYGTGALNIDASRVGYQSEVDMRLETRGVHVGNAYDGLTDGAAFQKKVNPVAAVNVAGRWPANVVLSHHSECRRLGERTIEGGRPIRVSEKRDDLGTEYVSATYAGRMNDSLQPGSRSLGAADQVVGVYECHPDCPVHLLDEQAGPAGSNSRMPQRSDGSRSAGTGASWDIGEMSEHTSPTYDTRGAGPARFYNTFEGETRFLYQAKPPQKERNLGLGRYLEVKVAPKGRDPFVLLCDTEDGLRPIPTWRMSAEDAEVWGRELGLPVIDPSDPLESLWDALTPILSPEQIPPTKAKASWKGSYVEPDGTEVAVSIAPWRSPHPTVKSRVLMAWLCKLITPPAGIVLDPFFGSGSTALGALDGGFDCIGIEREAEYVDVASHRIDGAGAEVTVEPFAAIEALCSWFAPGPGCQEDGTAETEDVEEGAHTNTPMVASAESVPLEGQVDVGLPEDTFVHLPRALFEELLAALERVS